jgi:intein/homing endonuclease
MGEHKQGYGGFPAGTVVGSNIIEDIKEGDLVESYDARGNVFCRREVLKIACSRVDVLLKIILASGSVIACTPGHFVFTGVGWRKASDLQRHDFMHRVGLRSMRFVQVVDVQYLSDAGVKRYCPEGVVYNLGVEDTNSYLVDEGYVVRACHS